MKAFKKTLGVFCIMLGVTGIGQGAFASADDAYEVYLGPSIIDFQENLQQPSLYVVTPSASLTEAETAVKRFWSWYNYTHPIIYHLPAMVAVTPAPSASLIAQAAPQKVVPAPLSAPVSAHTQDFVFVPPPPPFISDSDINKKILADAQAQSNSASQPSAGTPPLVVAQPSVNPQGVAQPSVNPPRVAQAKVIVQQPVTPVSAAPSLSPAVAPVAGHAEAPVVGHAEAPGGAHAAATLVTPATAPVAISAHQESDAIDPARQVINQTAQINASLNNNPQVNPCALPSIPPMGAAPPGLLTPEAAIELALSDNLRFEGRANISGDDAMPSCVFMNSKVTIVYDYCAKGAVAELGMTIYTHDGRSVHFAVASESENGGNAQRNVGDAARYGNGYPANWQWYVELNSPSSGSAPNLLKFSKVAKYHNDLSAHTMNCQVDRDPGGYNATANCSGSPALNSTWLPDAQNFAQKPSSDWFTLVNQLEAQSDAASMKDNQQYVGNGQ